MFRKVFVRGSLLSVIVIAGLFAYIDQRVRVRIRGDKLDHPPGIYSDTVFVTKDRVKSPSALRVQLEQRDYREVPDTPANPGEFAQKDGVFKIYTRAVRIPDGKIVPASHVQSDAASGVLRNETEPGLGGFYLEPELIGSLSAADVRKSQHKPLSQIPKHLQQAVIAVEDERFFSHLGVDLQGITRALFKNIAALRFVEGGSTITQQYARNVLFSPQKTVVRKVMEALAALSLEARLSKEEILEAYLNEVYMGQEGPLALHGIPEAARRFFGRNVEQLDIAEAALLAGIIQAPSKLSPRRHLERAKERQGLVLKRMLQLNFIKEAQYKEALKTKLNILPQPDFARSSQHFSAAVRAEIGKIFDVDSAFESGVAVFTTIHPGIQRCAELGVSRGLAELENNFALLAKRESPIEAGLVAIEPHSGKVLAWVGGRDYQRNQFDHVSQSRRQAGSTLKPFVYLTALDGKLNNYKVATALSVIPDKPFRVELVTKDSWEPLNYDKKFRGDVTLRYALENSLNIPAAYVAQKTGLDALVRTLKRFHLTADTLPVPALALGALDVSLLDLTAAYAALANGGNFAAPRLYLSAISRRGDVVANSTLQENQITDEGAVFVLTNILQGVVERGTAKAVRARGYTRPLAGKTGTSDSNRDAWFVAYTPRLAAGVWVGSDDNTETGLTGSSGAVPLWTEFMKCADGFLEQSSFVPPGDVLFSSIDSDSGGLATAGCPGPSVIKEVFVKGTEPAFLCPIHSPYGEEPALRGKPQKAKETETKSKKKKRSRSLWEILFD